MQQRCEMTKTTSGGGKLSDVVLLAQQSADRAEEHARNRGSPGARARARVCVTHTPGHARTPISSATLRAFPSQRWPGQPHMSFSGPDNVADPDPAEPAPTATPSLTPTPRTTSLRST